jgi:hypothetical protein
MAVAELGITATSSKSFTFAAAPRQPPSTSAKNRPGSDGKWPVYDIWQIPRPGSFLLVSSANKSFSLGQAAASDLCHSLRGARSMVASVGTLYSDGKP